MLTRVGLLLVATLCLGANECRLNEDDLGPEDDVAFETLEDDDGNEVRGAESGIVAKQLIVIRDADTFTDFWADHTALMAPRPGEPDVDFDTDMVIGAFMGERETDEYRIEIEEIRENDEFMIVEIEMETPGDNCDPDDTTTQPHHVVVLPDTDKPVQFSEATVEAPAC